MRLADVKRLRSWEFVRLVGASGEVYGAMVAAMQEQNRAFGRPPKLPLADQVLLCLHVLARVPHVGGYQVELRCQCNHGVAHSAKSGKRAVGVGTLHVTGQEGAALTRAQDRFGASECH